MAEKHFLTRFRRRSGAGFFFDTILMADGKIVIAIQLQEHAEELSGKLLILIVKDPVIDAEKTARGVLRHLDRIDVDQMAGCLQKMIDPVCVFHPCIIADIIV